MSCCATARLLRVVMVLTLSAPVRADNPRVALKLESATFAEAAAALSKASGLTLELHRRVQGGAPAPPPAILEERSSFNWADVRFAQALRELCERYELNPSRQADGYVLFWRGPAPGLPAPPAKPVGLVEKRGVRLFVSQVRTFDNRHRELDLNTGETRVQGNSSLNLSVSGRVLDGEADAIAGVANVVARDDQGTLIPAREGGRSSTDRSLTGLFPDEWSDGISLSGPHPRARNLAWLEGDLMVYRVHRRHRVEIPLAAAGEPAVAELGGVRIEVMEFEPGGLADGGLAAGDARLVARITLLPGSPISWDMGWLGTALLVGASGKVYRSSGGGGGGGGGSSRAYRYEYEWKYAPLPEPAVKALFYLPEKDDAVRLFSFRMENIPLPDDAAVLAQPPPAPAAPNRVVPPPPLSRRREAQPYFASGGGILLTKVELAGAPAPEGTLSLGLSRRDGTEWSGIRWVEVDVDKDGRARLEDLQPGTYRLLRVYRPAAAVKLPGPGRWTNDEIRIEVTAGKEAAVPPLQWRRDTTDTRR